MPNKFSTPFNDVRDRCCCGSCRRTELDACYLGRLSTVLACLDVRVAVTLWLLRFLIKVRGRNKTRTYRDHRVNDPQVFQFSSNEKFAVTGRIRGQGQLWFWYILHLVKQGMFFGRLAFLNLLQCLSFRNYIFYGFSTAFSMGRPGNAVTSPVLLFVSLVSIMQVSNSETRMFSITPQPRD